MIVQVDPSQVVSLRDWFLPEDVAWPIGMHVINTGNGAFFVDRWPDPTVVIADSAGNYKLLGNPDALQPEELRDRIGGFVDAPRKFFPLLQGIDAGVKVWDRVIYELSARPRFAVRGDCVVRRLVTTDAHHLWGLTPESAWISKTWGGPAGLASSGYAWGAFADQRLVSVACTFFLGERYEELGVVTEPGFRGRGLGVACTGALCEDVLTRRRRPSWSTSPDNAASVRLAEKLGFALVRRGHLYVVGVTIPEAPGADTIS
jgi:GNAT superfamily N-acetyltransferase